jgi:hypothetical protein
MQPARTIVMPEQSATDAVQRATLLSRIVFGTAALALVLLSFGLIVTAVGVVVAAFTTAAPVDRALLDAVGYMVIGIAVFDVAKYLLEEEVVRTRELRSAAEARRSLTKFLSTIAIAVFLEALVGVFETAKDDIRLMIYPTLLLIAGVFMILGLGLYIRFSAQAEMQVGVQDERADAQREAADHRERRRPPAG